MIRDRLRDGRAVRYAGPPYVVERQLRDGSWIPVALGIRAKDSDSAVNEYRSCVPAGVWRNVALRARLQDQGQLDGSTISGLQMRKGRAS